MTKKQMLDSMAEKLQFAFKRLNMVFGCRENHLDWNYPRNSLHTIHSTRYTTHSTLFTVHYNVTQCIIHDTKYTI